MKKSGLGRGLDVLLPEPEEENGVQSVSVYDIDNNPGQPRKHFPEESLSQLAESIRSAGVMIWLTRVSEKSMADWISSLSFFSMAPSTFTMASSSSR